MLRVGCSSSSRAFCRPWHPMHTRGCAGKRPLRCASSHSAAAVNAKKNMEVEVKLKLSKEGHDAVVELLKGSQVNLYNQENYFFDGAAKELSSKRMVLRCRFYNGAEKALVTLKGQMVVADGIGRATEIEDPVDPVAAREFLTDPTALLRMDLPVLRKLRECAAPLYSAHQTWQRACLLAVSVDALVCLGGFKNIRKEIKWEGQLLEVDETQYDWGSMYEIECETTEPEAVRDKIAAFLDANGIQYEYKVATKFANFVNRTLE